LKRVAVFCGSSPGAQPAYGEVARGLGRLLAERGLGLVYGGASVGLMGAVARAALEAGGEVIGVIPRSLADREVAFTGLADLRVVGTMHDRKLAIADLSDAFIALPGGLGTLEEVFEVLTWGQLGMHAKPCGLLNVSGYYDRLIAFLDHTAAEQFIEPEHRAMILVDDQPAALLDQFATYQPPRLDKAEWVRRLNDA
jgi:uncharacterized protein (TIGR00730 family)